MSGHGGNKPVAWLIVAVVALSVLESAGPTLIGLTHALVPLVIAVGALVIVARLVWFFTTHH
jgi:hypothetical protein